LVTNQEIGAISSGTWAGGINRFGDVCGYYTVDRGTNSVNYPYPYESKPFVYRDATGMLPLVGTNARFSGFSSGINDRGQVAFWGTPDNVHSYAYRYAPMTGIQWLGTFGDGAGDVAGGINNRGDVVGRSDVLDGVHGWEFPFLYTDATGIVKLEGPVENFEGNAIAINDLGHIALAAYGCIYLYAPETGMVPIGEGLPYGLNHRDVVVGTAPDAEGWWRATMYLNGMTRLLTPAGMNATALGINDHNVVVGEESTVGRSPRIFVWTDREGLMWLNEFLEPGYGVGSPSGINEHGQIAAGGYYVPPHGGTFAVRLDPIPPKLTVQRASTSLVVTWNPAWLGVVLESTESLTAPNWQPLDTGGTNVVALTPDAPQRFFRLNLEALRGLCCPPQ
jgi:uncharacterized membrane protein